MFRLQRYENFVVAANIFLLNGVLHPVTDYWSVKLRINTEDTKTTLVFKTSDFMD